MTIRTYGLIAEFRSPEELLSAAFQAREKGYRRMDAYSPFPVEGLAELVGLKRDAIAPITLAGGIAGGAGGYFMQYWANLIGYPINVGGRPYHSWPSFIPVTFELTVLGAATAALVGMIALNRLPQPYHPVFNVEAFEAASLDRFFLCIRADDLRFSLAETRAFLETLSPVSVAEVPS